MVHFVSLSANICKVGSRNSSRAKRVVAISVARPGQVALLLGRSCRRWKVSEKGLRTGKDFGAVAPIDCHQCGVQIELDHDGHVQFVVDSFGSDSERVHNAHLEVVDSGLVLGGEDILVDFAYVVLLACRIVDPSQFNCVLHQGQEAFAGRITEQGQIAVLGQRGRSRCVYVMLATGTLPSPSESA